MPLWSDSFDRADGVVGSNWTVPTASVAIVSNKLTGASNALALAGSVTGPTSAMAEALVTFGASYDAVVMPVVKSAADGTSFYSARAYRSGANLQLDLLMLSGGGWTGVAAYTLLSSAPTSGTLRITWAANVATLFFNGTQYCQGAASTLAANTHVGLKFWTSGQAADSFDASGDGSPQLIVSPRVVGTDDGDQLLSILGVAVTWTPGSPGTPAFTVNGGALSAQQISSTSNASVLFSPPLTPGVVTLSDPVNGISATITVVSGTYAGGSGTGGGVMPSSVVDWLTLQASHPGLVLTDLDTTEGATDGVYLKGAFGELLFGKRVTVGTSASPGFVTPGHDFSSDLLMWLTGGYLPTMATPEPPGQTTIKQDLDGLLAHWLSVRGEADLTLQAVITAIRGTGAYSNTDLYDAITSGSSSAVLDAIAAAQGDPLATVKAVLDSLFVLGGTTNNYTLSTVKTWVEAVRGSGLPTVKGVLDKLGGSSNTIETRIDALSDLIVTETTIQSIIDILAGTLTGRAGSTISGVLDAINALPAPTSSGGVGPPVWPGDSLVTLGEELDLADDLEVGGPMHGLIFTITGQPVQPHKYMFGTVASWSRVGAVIFCTDRGDYERSQTFSLDRQIMVPQTMAEAASAVLRVNNGWTGTVRSWRTS